MGGPGSGRRPGGGSKNKVIGRGSASKNLKYAKMQLGNAKIRRGINEPSLKSSQGKVKYLKKVSRGK